MSEKKPAKRTLSSTRSSSRQGQRNGASRVVRASSLEHDFVDPTQLSPEVDDDDKNIGLRTAQASSKKTLDFQQRKKEQRKAHRHYWMVRIGVATLSVIFLIFAVWALIFSPWLKIQSEDIRISGLQTWVRAESIQKYSNTTIGRSLVITSTNELEKEIDALPGVSAVHVTKDFPHGLKIVVAEETPTALLFTEDNNDYVAVDASARTILTVKEAVAGIPVINVPTAKSGLRNDAVLQAIEVLAALDQGTRSQVTSTQATTQDSITTALNSGYTVVWGNATAMETKQKIIAQVIQKLQAEGTQSGTIDVSAPSRPIIR